MKDPNVTVRIELDDRVSPALKALELVMEYAAHSDAASLHGWPQCSEYDPEVPDSRCRDWAMVVDGSEMCDGCVQREVLSLRRAMASIERAKIKRKMLALARRVREGDGRG